MSAALALSQASYGQAQTSPATAEPQPETTPSAPFGFESVASIAAGWAARDWESPAAPLSGPFKDIDYDKYRAIRFKRDADPWKDIPGFGLDLLSPGMIFYEPVRINIVRDGVPQPLPFDPSVFDFDPAHFPPEAAQATPDEMGWSGFRIRSALNKPDILDELAVFQGASYFRVLGRGNRYGLSARGLPSAPAAPRARNSRSSASSGSTTPIRSPAPSPFRRCWTANPSRADTNSCWRRARNR